MIVRGKERLRADFRGVNQILDHRPGDAQAIERAGASSDLVEDDQRVCRRAAQDVRHLVHLHHERGLAARQVIRRAHAREDAVDNADLRAVRRDKAAHMRHQRDERHLPHVGALASHVRPGDNQHAVVVFIHQRAVGHKELIAVQSRLHDRMTAVFDGKHAVRRDFRTDIVVAHGSNRQRQQRVERLEAHGRLLDARNLRRQEVADLDEEALLQADGFLLRAQNGFLNLVQLRRHVALAVGQRLLAGIAVRHLIVVRLGDLDVVAKDLVVLNLEVFDLGQLALLRLQVGNPLLTVRGSLAQLVQLRIVAVPDEMAVAHQQRRIRVDRPREQIHHVVKRRQLLQQLAQHARGIQPLDGGVDCRHMRKRVAQRQTVLGVDAAVGNAAEQALHVVDLRQLLAEQVGGHIVFLEHLHRVEPTVDLLLHRQRLLDKAAQHAAAHRRAGIIQHAEQRPLLLAGAHGLRQFQIAPGRVVEHHEPLVVVLGDAGDVLERVLLRLLQVLHQRARRADAQLQPFQAKRLQGLHPEVLQQRRLGLGMLEIHAVFDAVRQIRRPGRQLAVRDDFLRRDAGQLVLQAGARLVNLVDAEFARGHVGKGQSRLAAVHADGEQVAVAAILEHGLLDHRARRHHADDVPLDQALGRRRVFHLLADGHLVALFDQTVDIRLGAVERHAAHRRALLHAAAFPRQRQLQLPGNELGVLKEHLIEVAEPEEQDHARILVLHIQILAHHGGHLRHVSASVREEWESLQWQPEQPLQLPEQPPCCGSSPVMMYSSTLLTWFIISEKCWRAVVIASTAGIAFSFF